MKINSKIFIPLVVLVGIVVIGGGSYLAKQGAKQTPADTQTVESLKTEVGELKSSIEFMDAKLKAQQAIIDGLTMAQSELDKKTQDIAKAVYATVEAGETLEERVNILWSWRWTNFKPY